jgi:hypothetical protein
MIKTTTRRRETVATLVRVLVVFDALTFLLGAVSHSSIRIPLGFATIAEPQIIDATIVEGLSGLLFVVSAYAVFTSPARHGPGGWCWPPTSSRLGTSSWASGQLRLASARAPT